MTAPQKTEDRCPRNPDIIEATNNMKWLMRLSWGSFLIGLAVLVLVIKGIFGAGYMSSQIEQNTLSITEVRSEQKTLQKDFHILQEEVRYGRAK